MSATAELDPVLRFAVKMLHSPSADSAEKIRMALDELIKQRHGAHKMLVNTLPKKYLAEESLAPGSGAQSISRRPSHKSIDSKASVSSSTIDSPVHMTITMDSGIAENIEDGMVISVPDDDEEDDYMLTEEEHLRELEDLMCLVCRRMDVSARNRLIECVECHSLYHQECHTPAISDSDANEQEFSWCCCMCKNKMKTSSSAVASPAKSSSSHSSSSSSSSTSFQKIHTKTESSGVTVQTISITTALPSLSAATSSSSGGGVHHSHHKSSKSSSSSSRHHHSKSSSSHSTSSRDRERDRGGNGGEASSSSSSKSSSTTAVTPSINIISADKRLANMKKKAAKMQESRRKHK